MIDKEKLKKVLDNSKIVPCFWTEQFLIRVGTKEDCEFIFNTLKEISDGS